jgi:DNA-binding transcriptional regulator YiaG
MRARGGCANRYASVPPLPGTGLTYFHTQNMSMKMGTQKSSKKPQYLAFGHRLAELREAARISRQADFARRIDASQQTVSRWEAGLSRPREKQLPLIAGVLGVSVDELRIGAG